MIRTALPALLSLLLPFTGGAQPYQSIFGKTSTVWVFQWYQSGPIQDTAFITGDTVVNGLAYKKLTTASSAHGASVFGGGLLREDTLSGKVWYKGLYILFVPSDTAERLAFDYSLQPGDSFDVSGATFGAAWGIPHSFTLVDSVRSIGGSRHIYFRGAWNWDFGKLPPEPYTMIEGIGSNTGILAKLWPTNMLHPYLLCSYKDGIQTSYRNRSYAGVCDPATLSIRPGPPTTPALFPNPAKDFVCISGLPVSRAWMIEIFSSEGKCVGRIQQPRGDISLQGFADGLYFVKVTANDAPVYLKLMIRR